MTTLGTLIDCCVCPFHDGDVTGLSLQQLLRRTLSSLSICPVPPACGQDTITSRGLVFTYDEKFCVRSIGAKFGFENYTQRNILARETKLNGKTLPGILTPSLTQYWTAAQTLGSHKPCITLGRCLEQYIYLYGQYYSPCSGFLSPKF